MWLVFALAALVMLVAGVAGSYVVKTMPHKVPPDVFPHLPLIENIAVCTGLALALFGVALALRRLKRYERGGLKRMRRSARLSTPTSARRRDKSEEDPDEEPGGTGDPDATLAFDDEPATKRLRRI